MYKCGLLRGCIMTHVMVLSFLCIATTEMQMTHHSAERVICSTRLFLVPLLPFIFLNTYLCFFLTAVSSFRLISLSL